jgi:pSer/pThr/pTyr-binding forkhead associated (FHA) protein
MLQPGAVVKFGKDASSDVVLAHPSCSARHAKLRVPRGEEEVNDGETVGALCIVDLASTNGTRVEGRLLDTGRYVDLWDGATVRFADSSREYIFHRVKR